MSSKESSSEHAQMVFFNLVRAHKNGAIAAGFENGKYIIYPSPLVDKDGFEKMAEDYAQRLLKNGVPSRDAIETTEKIKTIFYAGTATEQCETFTNLQNAVDALSNKNGHIRQK